MIWLILCSVLSWSQTPVTIGSKAFTEGYLLSELAAQKLEGLGTPVSRHFGLGGTGLLYEALQTNQIDLYPEYSGTISAAILKQPGLKDTAAIRKALAPLGLTISDSIGFRNNYALAVRAAVARRLHLKTITDLSRLPNSLQAAFSHEFISRPDGYPGLHETYGLNLKIQALEHSLAFEAVKDDKADVIDVYTTDAKIAKLDLVLLEDDKNYFPTYDAVWLTRIDFVRSHPGEWTELTRLHVDVNKMRALNGEVDLNHRSFSEAIHDFLHTTRNDAGPDWHAEIWLRTKQHILLVSVSLLFACIIGIPLGILAALHELTGQLILLVSGTLQTIPSLALLCFLIPLVGIGTKAALIALFLYSLLPIVLNTYTGLRSIDPNLIQMSQALGLTFFQRLRLIEIPLAIPNLIAGIRTATVIGIGTATLAALIGAGGYGVPIVTGLAINDIPTILTGAIPAGVMALIANFGFHLIEKFGGLSGLFGRHKT